VNNQASYIAPKSK